MNFTWVPFPMSHVWNMFWTLVLTECVVDIYKENTSEGTEREFIYFLYVYCVSSLKHCISQELFPLHYESFSYPLNTETAFQINNKNTLLRQQIWKTKACAQYLHCCKTFFFYNYEEKPHQVRNRRLMKSLFVLLLCTLIKQPWGLKCCYQTQKILVCWGTKIHFRLYWMALVINLKVTYISEIQFENNPKGIISC